MKLPEDPVMLMSLVNMKMRDGDYSDLKDFCLREGIDEKELISRLAAAGFEYMENLRQFR